MKDNRLYTVKDLIKDLEGFDPNAEIIPSPHSDDYLFEIDNRNSKLNTEYPVADIYKIMTFAQFSHYNNEE